HTVGAHTQRVARFVLGADHYGGNGAIRAYYHSTLIESYHVIDGVGREQSDTYIALSLGYPQQFIRWRSYGVVRGHSCQRIVAPDHPAVLQNIATIAGGPGRAAAHCRW